MFKIEQMEDGYYLMSYEVNNEAIKVKQTKVFKEVEVDIKLEDLKPIENGFKIEIKDI